MMNVTDIAGKITNTFLILSLSRYLKPNPINNGTITIVSTLATIAQKLTFSADPAKRSVNPGVNSGDNSVDTVVNEIE